MKLRSVTQSPERRGSSGKLKIGIALSLRRAFRPFLQSLYAHLFSTPNVIVTPHRMGYNNEKSSTRKFGSVRVHAAGGQVMGCST